MTKTEALRLFGSIQAAALAMRISNQAVSKWPEQLTQDLEDRVQAALWRRSQGVEWRPQARPPRPQRPPAPASTSTPATTTNPQSEGATSTEDQP